MSDKMASLRECESQGSICLQSTFRNQQLREAIVCLCDNLCLKVHNHIVFSVLRAIDFPPFLLTSTVCRNIMPCQKIVFSPTLAKLPRICPVLARNIKREINFCQLAKVFLLNRKLS